MQSSIVSRKLGRIWKTFCSTKIIPVEVNSEECRAVKGYLSQFVAATRHFLQIALDSRKGNLAFNDRRGVEDLVFIVDDIHLFFGNGDLLGRPAHVIPANSRRSRAINLITGTSSAHYFVAGIPLLEDTNDLDPVARSGVNNRQKIYKSKHVCLGQWVISILLYPGLRG